MAIPLQGLAAASMMLCATEHHEISATQFSQPGDHQHDVGDEAHEGHQQHAQSHEADAHSSDAVTTHQHSAKDKCSTCAACCVGAVMLTSYLVSPISRPSSEKIDMVFSSHVGHISDGLERPPRA